MSSNAAKWVECEIDDVADAYGQSRESAIKHVRTLLDEDEYRDALTDQEIEAASAYIKAKYPLLTPKGTA